MRKFSVRRTAFALFLIFPMLLCLFYLRVHYYCATWLHLDMHGPLPADFDIYWDLGNGFNEWDKVNTKIQTVYIIKEEAKHDSDIHLVRILLPQRQIRALKLVPVHPDRNFAQLTRVCISTSGVAGDQLFSYFKSSPSPRTLEFSLDQYPGTKDELVFKNLNIPNRLFNRTLFFLQGCLAGICTYFIFWFLAQIRNHGGIRGLLWQEQRKYFTSFWVISVLVFSLWLLGQWPGAMTPDSLWTWDQSVGMWFDAWHPPLFYFYLVMLRQFFDSPAMVGIFQILATATLSSYIFYYTISLGVRPRYVILFYLLFLFSIPIGLMNIVVWKDVPASLAVVALSFYLYQKREAKERLGKAEPVEYLFPLLLLITFACEIRYTGTVFYVLLPFILILVLHKRDYFKVIFFIILLFYAAKIWLPGHISTAVLRQQLAIYLNPIVAIARESTYYSKDKEADRAFLSRFMDIDKAIAVYTPEIVSPILDGANIVKYDKITLADVEELRKFCARFVMDNLPIYLGSRITMLTSAFSFSYKAEVYYNNIPSMGMGMYAYSPNIWNLRYEPLFKSLNDLQNRLIPVTNIPNGFLCWRTLVWDLSIPLILIVFALILTRPFSAPWVYVIPSLFILAGLFLLMPGFGWRYLYSLYLGAFFIVPLCLPDGTLQSERKRT